MLEGVHRLNSRQAASPLTFNRFTIAALALVYWRSKKVCSSGCIRRTHFLAAPHHPRSAFVQCLEAFIVQTPGQHRTNAPPGWWEAAKNLFQVRLSSTAWTPHLFASPAIVNINRGGARQLFKWWTPPSMVPMHFLDGEELPKNFSKCIRRTQPELHNCSSILVL